MAWCSAHLAGIQIATCVAEDECRERYTSGAPAAGSTLLSALAWCFLPKQGLFPRIHTAPERLIDFWGPLSTDDLVSCLTEKTGNNQLEFSLPREAPYAPTPSHPSSSALASLKCVGPPPPFRPTPTLVRSHLRALLHQFPPLFLCSFNVFLLALFQKEPLL